MSRLEFDETYACGLLARRLSIPTIPVATNRTNPTMASHRRPSRANPMMDTTSHTANRTTTRVSILRPYAEVTGVGRRHVARAALGGEAGTGHDCSTCPDCVHDGHRCCGCYDGACCQDREAGTDG